MDIANFEAEFCIYKKQTFKTYIYSTFCAGTGRFIGSVHIGDDFSRSFFHYGKSRNFCCDHILHFQTYSDLLVVKFESK